MAETLSQSDIDALLAAAGGGVQSGAPGGAGSAMPRHVRRMDFKRPSKFNKDQLRTIQMLHEAFCRRASTYMSSVVRSLVEVSVTGAEQIPFGDYARTLPVPTFASVLEISPLGTTAMASMDMPLVFSILDRMLGGPGTMTARVRELTEIERGLSSTMMERLLKELSDAWSDLVPVDFNLRSIEMNAQFAQIASASEPCVLIDMVISIGPAEGKLQFCLPYRAIDKIVNDLTAHKYFAIGDEKEDSRDSLIDGMRQVRAPIKAEIGRVRVPVEVVLALKPGSVVPLGRRVGDGITLSVGNTPAYDAIPGRDGKHIAVRVVGPIDAEGTL